jgi:hypothetical protein
MKKFMIKEVSNNDDLPVYGKITVDFNQYSDIENYIQAPPSTEWGISSDILHKLIPVPAGYNKVSFRYDGSKRYTYAFLTATNNTGSVPFSSSDGSRHTLSVDSGWLDIPTDALYIYVFSYASSSATQGLPSDMKFKAV